MLNQASKHDRSNEARKKALKWAQKTEMHPTDNKNTQITDLSKQHEQGTRNVQIEKLDTDII